MNQRFVLVRHGGNREGRISPISIAALVSATLLMGLGFWTMSLRPEARAVTAPEETVLRIYCAAGIAKPVEEVVEAFNREYQTRVEIVRLGGSGELAGLIETEFESEVEPSPDLYVTADDLLLEIAAKKGIVAEQLPLAIQKPVIAVPVDSTLSHKTFQEIAEDSTLDFGICSNRAAVGKLARRIAKRDGFEEALESNKKTESENVMVLAQSLVSRSLDAAVVWDTTVKQVNAASSEPKLRVLCDADSKREYESNIATGVLSRSKNPTLALKFARYLTSPEKGKQAFEKYGFHFVEGDSWEERPEVHIYLGSMFTPVLEERLREFADREGIDLYSRWEGCGKLSASINAIKDPDLFPDAYLACDRIFLERVQQHFRDPITVSTNDIVMAIRNDVRHTIVHPKDVMADGVRVGVCDPELSALGYLTRELLSQKPFAGVYSQLKDQASVTVDVGPTLISQLSAGGLDVAFVYRSNVLADDELRKKIRIVEIDDLGQNTAFATQPWAVSKNTRNPELIHRLFLVIRDEESAGRFEKAGFRLQPSVKE